MSSYINAGLMAYDAYRGYKLGKRAYEIGTGSGSSKSYKRTTRTSTGAINAVDNRRVGFCKPGRAYPKATSTKQKAKVAYKLATDVEKKYIINSQKVTFNTIAGFPAVGSTGCVLLNGLQRGDTIQARTGDAVRFKCIRGAVTLFNATDNLTQTRIMIVRWRHGQGAAIKSAQASASAGDSNGYLFETTAASTVQVFSMYNFNSADMSKFDVLFDESFCVGLASGNGYPMPRFNISVDFTTSYKLGNAGTVADIEDGAIYLLVWGDDSTTTCGWDIACDFTDI